METPIINSKSYILLFEIINVKLLKNPVIHTVCCDKQSEHLPDSLRMLWASKSAWRKVLSTPVVKKVGVTSVGGSLTGGPKIQTTLDGNRSEETCYCEKLYVGLLIISRQLRVVCSTNLEFWHSQLFLFNPTTLSD